MSGPNRRGQRCAIEQAFSNQGEFVFLNEPDRGQYCSIVDVSGIGAHRRAVDAAHLISPGFTAAWVGITTLDTDELTKSTAEYGESGHGTNGCGLLGGLQRSRRNDVHAGLEWQCRCTGTGAYLRARNADRP